MKYITVHLFLFFFVSWGVSNNLSSLNKYDSYSKHWISSHEGWLNKNRANKCENSSSILPVCSSGINIEHKNNNCFEAYCVAHGGCVPTPIDTVDYSPPRLGYNNRSQTCSFAENTKPQFFPFFGLDKGVPPLYLEVDDVNLKIHGKIHYHSDNQCFTLSNAKIEYWHQTHYRQSFTDVQLRDHSCRAVALPSIDGSFTIETTMPVSYGPPRHINLLVTSSGFETLTTRIYFDKDIRLQQILSETEYGNTLNDFEESLDIVKMKDPRVVQLNYVPTLQNTTYDEAIPGYYETDLKVVLHPLRNIDVVKNTNGYKPENLTGIWQDSEGGLVRVESYGNIFIAVQHPHPRTWGSVYGSVHDFTIFGINFRSTNIPSLLEDREVFLYDWHQSDSIRTQSMTIGSVIAANSFSTHAGDMKIQWSGSYENDWSKVPDRGGYRYVRCCVHYYHISLCTHVYILYA